MEGTVLLIQKFGKYETWEKIGEGVYGSTYRSRDPLLDRQVAIKAFRDDLTTSPDFMEHFRREARLIASLRHPNIVTMIDGGEQEGLFYLVVEYLPGGSLAQMLKEPRPFSLSRALDILRPLADALDYAHSRRVVHRAVKPANILFAEDGRLVLTDFAIVKPSGRPGNGASFSILGVPEYLSPEQIMGKEASAESDQYSVGVIAYQMLSGRLPFSGSPESIFRGHLDQQPVDIRMLNNVMPKEISDTLQRALSKDPTKRFGNLKEFVDTLEQISIKLSREQGRALYQAAKEYMKLMQFDQAIGKLEQLQALRTSPEADALLKECVRRKQLAEEVQLLRNQIVQAQARIELLVNTETWLKGATPGSQNGGGLLHKVAGGLKR